MKILFAASECYPFAKAGGLGDVVGSLPKEIKKKGIDVRVIIPKYEDIHYSFKEKMRNICNFRVTVGWRNQYCGIEQLEHEGVTYYFVDNEYYFKRKGLYGYYDEGERIAYFSRAILESLTHIGFKPDIIHCNDWHTALVSVFLKEQYKYNPFYNEIKTFFTIHNLKYQGVFGKEVLGELLNMGEEVFTIDKLEFYEKVNFLKGGVIYSDVVSTVSETYSKEIQSEYFGEGLHQLLKSVNYKIYGIVNGIDYHVYNPERDKNIWANYSKFTGKNIINKIQLQKSLNLDVREEVPIISIVSRLVEGKGMDLIKCVLDDILNMDVQMVILGTGDSAYESFFKEKEKIYKGKLSANIYFDDKLSHKIYAASDIFLMPSLYEPCGLGQIIALRYGTLPVVRETGGLKDTIFSYNEYTGEGNGFSFSNINAQDMLYTIKRAIDFYYNKDIWEFLVKKAMACDYSWNNSAEKYLDIYKKILDN
ncbi:glycogen synthase [Clostridium acetireducens DSM 10703]|uniref:Glycogen synthase n=1 Tax=Clostridium acetireducens DSM 10703 TaxID=1121290 RepID=A0A1E8F051_9CLOT|nr:glycogen synthase GlgA [Clostridium acetireducens]OFI06766.1 glycogen synthase [Clostridium acetireducens DSM 10703]